MELTLTRQAGTQVLVTCDDRTSHTLDLLTLIPGKNGLSHPLDDPVAYGKYIESFAHVWPGGVWATTLENHHSREVFVNDFVYLLGFDLEKMTDSKAIELLESILI